MKIIFVIDSLQRHGTQRFLTHLTTGLEKLGYMQKVIVLNDAVDPGMAADLSRAGCAITVLGKQKLLLAGAGLWQLVGILRKVEPDIVMTMLDFADSLARPAARLARARSIVTSLRARNLAKPRWRRWLDRRTVQWADKVILNSEQIVTYAREKEGVRQDQVVVIQNGVDDLRARSGGLRRNYRLKLNLEPQTSLIGWMGRLTKQKNFPLLLQACDRLLTKRDWKVVLIGDGPGRARLQALMRTGKSAHRVSWLGSRVDTEGWLAAMDLFVHTADFEGMPNAVMEAMAMGLPVVASAVDGSRELIRDGITGYLVSPRDTSGFARRIDALIDDPDLAREMGNRAHDDVIKRFDLKRMIESYHTLFLSLVETKPT